VGRVQEAGRVNSLTQTLLKYTLPGVPDFYQGTELWDLSLVDPDNRRPVDFAERAKMLSALQSPDWESLTRNWQNGQVKLALTAHLLKLRNEFADLFRDGDYQPLEVKGPHADHVIAFARHRGSQAVIIAVARLFAPVSQAGRAWPTAQSFDGVIEAHGFALDDAVHRD